ncbi:hypothetical protein [Roseibium sp. MMSF_3412]|uniref:hypothetical protein n=1 Tax=Roseibium sp. MMSF_3412 TaxID=3046712 RepID=UPI00273FECB2|nr:hypothetical protein [Roseibium sp. MMSF_3412]
MKSHQQQWLQDIFESLPSVAFLLVWRQSGDLELAGWCGASLALMSFVLFHAVKSKMNPVLLGVNLHLLLVTPLIVGTFRLGLTDLGGFLAAYAHSGVLLSVFAAGLCLTVFTKRGFVGSAEMPPEQKWRYSMVMLAVSGAGMVWALSRPESSLVPVIITLTALIGGRRFLLARQADNSGPSAVAAFAVLPDREIPGSGIEA